MMKSSIGRRTSHEFLYRRRVFETVSSTVSNSNIYGSVRNIHLQVQDFQIQVTHTVWLEQQKLSILLKVTVIIMVVFQQIELLECQLEQRI